MDEAPVRRLTCADCGAALEPKPDMTNFTCSYCGSPHVIGRSLGSRTLEPGRGRVDQAQGDHAPTVAEVERKRLTGQLFAAEAILYSRLRGDGLKLGSKGMKANRWLIAAVCVICLGVIACALAALSILRPSHLSYLVESGLTGGCALIIFWHYDKKFKNYKRRWEAEIKPQLDEVHRLKRQIREKESAGYEVER